MNIIYYISDRPLIMLLILIVAIVLIYPIETYILIHSLLVEEDNLSKLEESEKILYGEDSENSEVYKFDIEEFKKQLEEMK